MISITYEMVDNWVWNNFLAQLDPYNIITQKDWWNPHKNIYFDCILLLVLNAHVIYVVRLSSI